MTILETLQSKRAALKTEMEAIVSAAEAESRSMTDDEGTAFDAKLSEITKTDARIDEVRTAEDREARAAEARVAAGEAGKAVVASPAVVTSEPTVYRKGDVENSYFRDLFNARTNGDRSAMERLIRNDKELRALSTVPASGGTAGFGGDFAPPKWIISDFAALARAGRKFADSIGPMALPSGISSVNLPKILTGTSTAKQATNNTALSQTDLTTGFVTSGISTYGGKQVVAMQLLQQSGIPFDEVVLADLAADYARTFDKAVIGGTGTAGDLLGVYTYFAANGTTNVTYTDASPTPAKLYSKIAGAIAGIETTRFVAPDVIWMTPARWNSFLGASDANGRPLVVPSMTAFNPIAVSDGVIAQGNVGTMLGLPVITDANIPSNIGAGTNQDVVLVGVRSDLRLWEGALQTEAFTATYADSLGVLFRAHAYSAQIPGRYTTSVSVISGTGLVPYAF
jgi:HK97 family phage major capsid protein